MNKKKYVSYEPDSEGNLAFTETEQEIWRRLYRQQIEVIPNRACDEFIQGLEDLGINDRHIPVPKEVTARLMEKTGWTALPVPAVIGPTKFFTILSERKFPVACFIRREEDFYYIKEPDIFHEIFGHCPLLTNQKYANFIEDYGKFALTCDKSDYKYLFRLFWFTVEFGLIETPHGDRIYGGGILSSIKETQTALKNSNVQYEDFDLLTIFRTPFRIDVPQNLYFKIKSYDQLYESLQCDIPSIIAKAREMGDLTPKFQLSDENGDVLEYTN